MKNKVIEVLNREHGKRVIEYWKSIWVDVGTFIGNQTREDDSEFRFYGVIDGRFDCYSERQAADYKAEIIHLPTELPKEEKSFPRIMLVSDDGDSWYKRVVFMQKCDRFLAWNDAETVEESECVYGNVPWRYAKDIEEPKEFTITLSDINSKIEDIKKLFGIDNEDVIIKID